MYIEFIGHSGAGKTTTVTATQTALAAANQTVHKRDTVFTDKQRRAYKVWWTVWYLWLLDWPTIICLGQWARLKSFKNAGQKAHEYIKLRWQLRQLSGTTDRALWDSGLVQLYSKCAVAGCLTEERAYTLLTARLPQDTVLVHLELSLPEAIERKRVRASAWGEASRARLERALASDPAQSAAAAEAALQVRLLERLATAGYRVITLDARQSPTALGEQLAAHLTTLDS